jgi:rhodanese-related sulfurtransferase
MTPRLHKNREGKAMKTLALTIALVMGTGTAMAQTEVGITKDAASVTVQTANGPVQINRIQDAANEISGEWALTSRPCPDFCIQPQIPAAGVSTIGELELIEMLQDPEAVVVDSRTRDWFDGGTIPGAINIPYTFIVDELAQLGCEPDFDGWDCQDAKRAALFCNGVWCGQSPTAIRAMISAGYPADRIYYYRGGMQIWRMLGLTVTGDE